MSNPKFDAVIKAVRERRDVNGVVLDGKKYLQVKDRVEVFRSTFGDEYGIDSDVRLQDNNRVIAVAKIVDKLTGNVLSSGHALEYLKPEGYGLSAFETAETSAVGRALAFFGLAGGEFPSIDEMQGAGRKQEAVDERAMVNPPSQAFKPNPSLSVSDLRFYQPQFGHPDIDVWGEVSKVCDEVARIDTEANLNRYWAETRPFRDYLSDPQEDPHFLAELKAAFSTVKGMIQSKGRRV